MKQTLKPDDYVFYLYENEKLTGRVISIDTKKEKVKIEVCLSTKKMKSTVIEQIEVNYTEVEKITAKIKK